MASLSPLQVLWALIILLCLLRCTFAQFPAVCNTPENLQSKVCCPNNCNGRGDCVNVKSNAERQSVDADPEIVAVLKNTSNVSEKGNRIDSRYLWPTMVFENVCICSGKFYGVDCNECAFGWSGENCGTKKQVVQRRSFGSLSDSEKQNVKNGMLMLKSEMGYWSVVIEEPLTVSGTVTLQDVSTYDFLVYIHNYVSRDASKSCQTLNGGINVDFAHSGPNFLVWHRTYLLILERALQRVLDNTSFGLPYWKWEDNDLSVFDKRYFGKLSSTHGIIQDIEGGLNWNTVCDITYRQKTVDNTIAYWEDDNSSYCMAFWVPCNPNADLRYGNRLQRGNAETYLPNVREIEIAIAAPEYDKSNAEGKYRQDSPRDSFRSRLEGWSLICSTSNSDLCVGPQVLSGSQRLHNNVHDWINGHMSVPPSAVNDPVFSLHHSNIDRILESWMQRGFPSGEIPPYVPDSGGHIGHNLNDYMVPFFPLITPNQQYSTSENWGYMYDTLIVATLNDKPDIPDCTYTKENIRECRICTAHSSDSPTQCNRFEFDLTTNTGMYRQNCLLSSEDMRVCSAIEPTVRPTLRPPSGSSSKRINASLLLFLLIAFLTLVLED
ncbi:L-dopachrome tautomerase-like [Halichondria panicea]|uniref:L-dopachrome tautomerase-like n=1 Tax=Halichondria panicea TaxID=6063 RepID=UPI00312BC3B6